MNYYRPLEIETLSVAGIPESLRAMRLPKPQAVRTVNCEQIDLRLAENLVIAGNDHAKFARGCIVWYQLTCQVGWLIEYEQYEIGVTRLSSSSAMHGELKQLTGLELAEQKQRDLVAKQYTIIDCASYQALRRIYMARKGHRHPDWGWFLLWIETLPYFNELIYPEGKKGKEKRMNTIELTKEQVDALRRGESITINPPKKVKPWEPPAGDWYINFFNDARHEGSDDDVRLAGRERATEELARRAAEASRKRDRLEAFRDQHWPNQHGTYYVCFNTSTERYYERNDHNLRSPGLVYGHREYAEKAAAMLNSGELVL